jgi:hypothetical protein
MTESELEAGLKEQFELEALKVENAKRKEKKKKDKQALVILCVAVIALCLGMALGYTSGYHSALVDFHHIAGSVLPPF